MNLDNALQRLHDALTAEINEQIEAFKAEMKAAEQANEPPKQPLPDDDEYLITREQAARRYGLAQRIFDQLYRNDPEFPSMRVGKRVMVHRQEADKYFTQRLGEYIDVQ